MASDKLTAPDTSTSKYAGKPDYATDLSQHAAGLEYTKGSAKTPKGADSELMSKNWYDSLLNPFHVISVSGGNYPITDDANAANNARIQEARFATALDLINNPLGARIYAPADFLLCARYGLPINRMITLRRFATPVGDNITQILTGEGSDDKPGRGVYDPDIGRLVTYMDQTTNKLSDVLSMSWGLNWEEKQAQTETVSENYDPGSGSFSGGWMGSLNKWLDSGSANEVVQGKNRLNYDPTRDSNKIHGPVDAIASTYMRGIGLKHDMTFEITFDYELRSFNGVNQKTMFMDMLANVLAVTMNNGRFWGGARIWTGGRPSNLARKLQFLNPKNAEEFLANGKVAVTNFMKSFAPKTGSGKEAAVNVLKQIVQNGMNLALGKFLDMVGRPAMPQMNSLLRGDPVGDWHLTIGNPMNPILSVGNLILEDTKIEFGESLGYDDFPTSFKVTCQLKGGQPRDRAGIESMFNNGYGRIYMPSSTILKRKGAGSTSSLGQGADKTGVGGNSSEFSDDAYIKAADAYSEFLRETMDTDDIGISVKSAAATAQPPTPESGNATSAAATQEQNSDPNPLADNQSSQKKDNSVTVNGVTYANHHELYLAQKRGEAPKPW